jgi:hypothetical protein
MPDRHRSEHVPRYDETTTLPPSLCRAIRAFVIASAARFARGQERQHKSMLIHVTRLTSVQARVHEQVREELESLRRRWTLAGDQTERELEELWEADFVPTSRAHSPDCLIPPWPVVSSHISEVLDRLEVRMINNTSRDVLAYEEHRNTGFHVIAIGGDKLSRGLTLEGLTVSYFLRASKMYDTLMQMGRWFGYRPDYEDLCRLYMTEELSEWFGHITDASEELRQEFDRMVAVNQTPADYGLRVRSHPILMVTSALKMRTGEELELSFAGDILETVAFHRDPSIASSNEDALASLVSALGPAIENPSRTRPDGTASWEGTRLWENVPASRVLAFLQRYTSHEANRKVRTELLSSYIERQVARHELIDWTVALISKEGKPAMFAALPIVPIERSLRIGTLSDGGDRYQIRRLLSPRDETIDLDRDAWKRALDLTRDKWQADPGRGQNADPPDEPGGKEIRSCRAMTDGLLLLYPLRLNDKTGVMDHVVLGMGISFPESPNAPRVRYRVTSLYYEQEFGPDE